MSDFSTTCLCPDVYCPVHAKCRCGSKVIIDDEDSLAFCPGCMHDVTPVGGCYREKRP